MPRQQSPDAPRQPSPDVPIREDSSEWATCTDWSETVSKQHSERSVGARCGPRPPSQRSSMVQNGSTGLAIRGERSQSALTHSEHMVKPRSPRNDIGREAGGRDERAPALTHGGRSMSWLSAPRTSRTECGESERAPQGRSMSSLSARSSRTEPERESGCGSKALAEHAESSEMEQQRAVVAEKLRELDELQATLKRKKEQVLAQLRNVSLPAGVALVWEADLKLDWAEHLREINASNMARVRQCGQCSIYYKCHYVAHAYGGVRRGKKVYYKKERMPACPHCGSSDPIERERATRRTEIHE